MGVHMRVDVSAGLGACVDSCQSCFQAAATVVVTVFLLVAEPVWNCYQVDTPSAQQPVRSSVSCCTKGGCVCALCVIFSLLGVLSVPSCSVVPSHSSLL